jgi:hypothetical protein
MTRDLSLHQDSIELSPAYYDAFDLETPESAWEEHLEQFQLERFFEAEDILEDDEPAEIRPPFNPLEVDASSELRWLANTARPHDAEMVEWVLIDLYQHSKDLRVPAWQPVDAEDLKRAQELLVSLCADGVALASRVETKTAEFRRLENRIRYVAWVLYDWWWQALGCHHDMYNLEVRGMAYVRHVLFESESYRGLMAARNKARDKYRDKWRCKDPDEKVKKKERDAKLQNGEARKSADRDRKRKARAARKAA